jgi:hypothetical protein
MLTNEATPHPYPLPSQGRGGFCRWRFQTALPPGQARGLHFSFNLPDATVTRPASFYSLTMGNPASFHADTPPLRALALG